AEIARCEAGVRSHARQIEELGVRVGRTEEEHKRLSDRRHELDDEIQHQEQTLGGLQEAKLNLLRTREAAEERVKDLKLLVSRNEKEGDHHKGEPHKTRARLHSLGELAARHEGFSLGSRLLLQRAEKERPKASEPDDTPRTVADLLIAPAELEV